MEIWNKIWRDKKGRVVVWQMPNAFLIGWALLTIIGLMTNGNTSSIFRDIGLASLVVWALLEVFKGVNYFRRVLGLVVLVYILLNVI